MKIGELAKQSGLAASTIRYYESIGLIKQVDRRPNGYRTYPAATVTTLGLITAAQQAGFSLDEIRSLLPTDLKHWQHETLVKALSSKIADIDTLLIRLTQSKARLLRLLDEIQFRPDDIDCASNARRILAHIHDYDGAGDTHPAQ